MAYKTYRLVLQQYTHYHECVSLYVCVGRVSSTATLAFFPLKFEVFWYYFC